MPCLVSILETSMEDTEEAGGSTSTVDSRDVEVATDDMKQSDHSGEMDESSPLFSKTGLPLNELRAELLDFLCSNEKAYFKSQQKGDPELSQEHKKSIAEDLLDRSPALFLRRFGQCLQKEHLKYFSGEAALLNSEAYEIKFHLKELERFYCKTAHNVDVKNRRYDALQKMLADGNSYFSEDEMRQRNPALYEHLVGQYLTEEERKERETPDLANISFVNLLLMKISRDETKELKNKQDKEESGNHSDLYESSDEIDEEDESSSKTWNERGTWGETSEDVTKMMEKRKEKKKRQRQKKCLSECMESEAEIADEERLLLMNEFVSTMYKSFIDGNDTDFDYSQVDCNPDYDCIDVRGRDEEEKYFDAETPEDEEMELEPNSVGSAVSPDLGGSGLPPLPSLAERRLAQEEEEDTLDAFMKTVKAPVQTSDLTTAFQNLCQQSQTLPTEKSRVFKKSHVIQINLKKE